MIVVSIVVAISLCFIAGVSKATQDVISHKYSISIFGYNRDRFDEYFWNPKKSWKNKWEFTYDGYKPKFPGSSTFFVFVTDAWHLAQFFHINSIIAAFFLLGCFQLIIPAIVGVILYRTTFEIFYRWVLIID
jgi:hypothetical protein